jgi:hypothetical protein
VGKADGRAKCAPADKLRVPTIFGASHWRPRLCTGIRWARRKGGFAHPNWLNTIATGVITVGIFTPLVLRIYEMDEPTKNDSFVNAFTRCLHCRGARSPSR